MLYLDTSVLMAYTLTRTMEPSRFQSTAQLFELINRGDVKAATSFYALHELLVIAISNTQPDWEAGSELARESLLTILQSRLLYVPIPRRRQDPAGQALFRTVGCDRRAPRHCCPRFGLQSVGSLR